jgi:hypothetical protein
LAPQDGAVDDTFLTSLPRTGVAMLSSVLHSERAVTINIQIMRAFVRLREVLNEHADLKKKIEEHDHQIQFIFKTLKQLLEPPQKPKKRIGF